nr:hypothetical protein [Adlercreutzia sp. ZJ242]
MPAFAAFEMLGGVEIVSIFWNRVEVLARALGSVVPFVDGHLRAQLRASTASAAVAALDIPHVHARMDELRIANIPAERARPKLYHPSTTLLPHFGQYAHLSSPRL